MQIAEARADREAEMPDGDCAIKPCTKLSGVVATQTSASAVSAPKNTNIPTMARGVHLIDLLLKIASTSNNAGRQSIG